jgi:hypothetical protein
MQNLLNFYVVYYSTYFALRVLLCVFLLCLFYFALYATVYAPPNSHLLCTVIFMHGHLKGFKATPALHARHAKVYLSSSGA